MSDAPLAPDTAAAASAATSPSLRLLPRSPGGEGDGEGEGPEKLTDRGVAVGNRARPHLPPSSSASPALSRSTPLSLLCCSQSASRRPEREAGRLVRGQAQGKIMKERRMMEGGEDGGIQPKE